MSNFAITVVRAAQQQVMNGTAYSYQFTLTASNPTNLSADIFRMRQAPLDPVAQTTTSFFDGVCSPWDLANLPETAPVPPGDLFRVATVTIIYTNLVEGQDAWTYIQQEIQFLLDSLDANALLANPETIIFDSNP
jgi:hypothetical protein